MTNTTSAGSTAASDRREHRRVLIEAPVGMAITRGGLVSWFCRHPRFHGNLRDASIGGMLCVSSRPIPKDSVVKLWVQVELQNRPRELHLLGDVVWSQPSERADVSLVGIRLRQYPSETVNAWVRTMIDELRIKDGAPPL